MQATAQPRASRHRRHLLPPDNGAGRHRTHWNHATAGQAMMRLPSAELISHTSVIIPPDRRWPRRFANLKLAAHRGHGHGSGLGLACTHPVGSSAL
jgi:hypothetical protein